MCTKLAKNSARIKRVFECVKGFFPVYKPKGEYSDHFVLWTRLSLEHTFGVIFRSHDVMVKAISPPLEPMASGILIMGLGSTAARLSRYFCFSDVHHKFTAKLGTATDNLMSDGNVTDEKPYDHITRLELEAACQKFLGKSKQLIPYRLRPTEKIIDEMFDEDEYNPFRPFPRYGTDPADRKGFIRSRGGVDVFCKDIFITEFNPPFFSGYIVSNNFFVRTFVHDLAKSLNSCAHVVDLERVKHGPVVCSDGIQKHDLHWEYISPALDTYNRTLVNYVRQFQDRLPPKERRFR